MADSASLMQPSIDRETPSSSSELLIILGRLKVLRSVKYFPRVDTFSALSEPSSSGTLFSSRSAVLQMSASWVVVFGLGELVVTRWLEKPSDTSAVHAQELKTRVVPSGTLLTSLDPAIKFASELAESPT